jgi:uncharacterized peroxidase-related enzyme
MAHIHLPEGLPGIRGPLVFSPDTTQPLCDLVEVLLRAPNSLTMAEREMIATYVSAKNDCYYCQTCHGSAAAQHLGGAPQDYELIAQMKCNCEAASLSDKMKALLAIAGKVQKGGKHVTAEDVERARSHGATDKEIHDTVLIAAAFCMFNRYVDGLDTWQPRDAEFYREVGKQTAALGYVARDWKQPLQTVSSNRAAPARP